MSVLLLGLDRFHPVSQAVQFLGADALYGEQLAGYKKGVAAFFRARLTKG